MYNMVLCRLVMYEIIGFTCLPALQVHYKSLDNLHHLLSKVAYLYALHPAAVQQTFND